MANDNFVPAAQNRGNPTLESAGVGRAVEPVGWLGLVDGWLTAGERIIEGARGGYDLLVSGAPVTEGAPGASPPASASAKVAGQSKGKATGSAATEGGLPNRIDSWIQRNGTLFTGGIVVAVLGVLWWLTKK